MNENRSPRKEIIKNIAIVFLAVLLVLTFFSNTIMNYSLPEATAVYVSQGTISEQIRGSGSISAAEQYEVKFEQSRKIKSVAVKSGQTVSEGDILFELDASESSELKEAKETLESLEYEYKKALLSFSSDTKYLTENLEIENAEDELANLKAEYKELTGKEYSSADQVSVGSAKELEKKITALNTELSSVDTEEMLDVSADNYKKISEKKKAVETAKEKEEDAQKKYDEAAKNYDGTDYGDQISSLEEQVLDSHDLISDLYFQYYSSLNDPEAAASVLTQIRTEEKNAEKLKRQLEKTISDSMLNSSAKSQVYHAQRNLSTAKDNVLSAEKALNALKREIKLNIKEQINLFTAELDNAKALDELITKLSEQEIKLATLRSNLEIKQTTDSVQTETAKLDLEVQENKLEKQKELIKSLSSDSTDSKIRAKVSGIVESVSVSAGDTASAGTALCVISIADKGYIIEFPVKLEQAKKVRIGDKAEVTSWYWGSEFTATLEEIRPDTANPQTQRILVFNITGNDITSGQTLTLSLGSKGQQYSTIVPNSAIREDSNGKFVLVMESKSSALGNRYKAVRYDVEVIAKDDNNSAVNGLLGSEFVITASTDPIKSGDQIRPAD